MKKGVKFALIGALAASLIPFVVDVDDSNPKAKKTSVKSLLYSVDLTRTPSEQENGSEKTSVSITVPGLLGEIVGKFCRKGEISDEFVEELVDKATDASENAEG